MYTKAYKLGWEHGYGAGWFGDSCANTNPYPAGTESDCYKEGWEDGNKEYKEDKRDVSI